jgi:hypothetical protein
MRVVGRIYGKKIPPLGITPFHIGTLLENTAASQTRLSCRMGIVRRADGRIQCITQYVMLAETLIIQISEYVPDFSTTITPYESCPKGYNIKVVGVDKQGCTEGTPKPKMRSINGMEFPEPLSNPYEFGAGDIIFVIDPLHHRIIEHTYHEADPVRPFELGLVQRTREGAEAQLRALVSAIGGKD